MSNSERVPENCAFTSPHSDPKAAQKEGASPGFGLAIPNGGLQVLSPSIEVYDLIPAALRDEKATQYDFAGQSLLSDVFPGRWVALSFVYNALKTLRLPHVQELSSKMKR